LSKITRHCSYVYFKAVVIKHLEQMAVKQHKNPVSPATNSRNGKLCQQLSIVLNTRQLKDVNECNIDRVSRQHLTTTISDVGLRTCA
jgi:hypothetical protein